MKIDSIRNLNGDQKFTVTITADDLIQVPLSDIDRMVLHECSESEKMSDTLLALELIARNLEQSTPQA